MRSISKSEVDYVESSMSNLPIEGAPQDNQTCLDVLIAANRLFDAYRAPRHARKQNVSPRERAWTTLIESLGECNNMP